MYTPILFTFGFSNHYFLKIWEYYLGQRLRLGRVKLIGMDGE